jgi:hypothetical protein
MTKEKEDDKTKKRKINQDEINSILEVRAMMTTECFTIYIGDEKHTHRIKQCSS